MVCRSYSEQGCQDSCSDRPAIFRVEPVVGIAEPVKVSALIRPHSRSLGLEQLYTFGGIEIVRALPREARVAHRAERAAKPGLMVQANPYEQSGHFELG